MTDKDLDEAIQGIPINKPKTISVEAAGRLLGVSRMCAYTAAKRGQIPTIRVGHRLVVPLAKLNAMLGEADERHLDLA